MSTTTVLDLRMGQIPYFPKGIIHPWGDNSLTTSVLDLRRDKFPISQEDFLVHETTIDRILRYSAFGGTSSLSPKRIFSSKRQQPIDYFGTRPLEGQAPYLKMILSSIRQQHVDYYSTRPSEGQVLYPLRGFFSSMRQQLIDYSGTQPSEGQVPCPWGDNRTTTTVLDPMKIQDF